MLGRWTPSRDRVTGPAGGGTAAATGEGAEPGGEDAGDAPGCEEAGTEDGDSGERADPVAGEAGEAGETGSEAGTRPGDEAAGEAGTGLGDEAVGEAGTEAGSEAGEAGEAAGRSWSAARPGGALCRMVKPGRTGSAREGPGADGEASCCSCLKGKHNSSK